MFKIVLSQVLLYNLPRIRLICVSVTLLSAEGRCNEETKKSYKRHKIFQKLD